MLLYRYILKELVKLLVVATAALVLVLSVGAAIKPLSEGMLGPWVLLKFIGYVMPAMLSLALPFAAAFAGTLVFYRMGADNEVAACAASGISYSNIMMPVAGLGLVLTLLTFLLSNWVVPWFWSRAARTVERDLPKLIVQQIQSKQTVTIRRLVVYADAAWDNQPIDPHEEGRRPGDPLPYNRIVLDGFAFGYKDKWTGKLQADGSARRAVADLYRHDNVNYVSIMLTDATIVNREESTVRGGVKKWPIKVEELPNPFGERAKFLSLAQLRDRARNPDSSQTVREFRNELRDGLAGAMALHRCYRDLGSAHGYQALELRGPGDDVYLISAPEVRLADGRVELAAVLDAPVSVHVRKGGVERRTLEAQNATIKVRQEFTTEEPRLDLELRTVAVRDPTLPIERSELKKPPIPLLRLSETIAGSLQGLGARPLLLRANEYQDQSDVMKKSRRLTERLDWLRRDVTARLHERAASAIGCLLVLLLASAMAMLLRQQVPLVIFFWCFLPTVLAIVAMHSGQNVLRSPDRVSITVGVMLIWLGNLLLAAVALTIFARLRRN